MAYDEVTLYNMALNAVGARDNISATTEASREAEVCNFWYETVRDKILSAARWPSATRFSRLALLEQASDDGIWTDGQPAPGFTYVYSVPSDYVYPQYLSTGERFSLGARANAVTINANTEDAILAYTSRQTVVALWDANLQMAVVYGLAAHICSPLTGKLNRAKLLMEQANAMLVEARVQAANSDDNMLESVPDWIAMRGYSGVYPTQRYVYPAGQLLSLPNVN